MVNTLLTILTNLFNIYLTIRYINIFLDQVKPERKKEIIVFGAYFIINTGAYLAFHLTSVNMLCSIAGISALVLLRTKSVKMYFLVTYSIYAINLLCDVVVVMLFVDYREGEVFNQVFVIIEDFLILICELLTERIVRNKRKEDGPQSIPLILVPFFSVVTMIILINIGDRKSIFIVGVSYLVINFLIFYLYDIVVQNANARYENRLLQQQVQVYGSQIDIIMQGEDRIKSLRHDMKHHLNELRYMIDKKEKQDALQYIDSMKGFLQIPDEIVESGNLEIDSLLNYMLRRAKSSLATVTVNVNIPERILPAFDINVILGNLLENAIEAAEQSEEKCLDVQICYGQGVMTLEIKNSFNGELRRKQGGFLTTKEGSENHGIGLGSVKRIVEKYNGLLKIETLENLFCVNAILYLSQF